MSNPLVLKRRFKSRAGSKVGWFDRWGDYWFEIPETDNQVEDTIKLYDSTLKNSERVEKFAKLIVCYVFGCGLVKGSLSLYQSEMPFIARMSIGFITLSGFLIAYYSMMYSLKLSHLQFFLFTHSACGKVPKFRFLPIYKIIVNTIASSLTVVFFSSMIAVPFYIYDVIKAIGK